MKFVRIKFPSSNVYQVECFFCFVFFNCFITLAFLFSEIGFLCRVFKPGKNKQDKQKREIVSSLWACCCRDLVRIFWNHNQYLDQGHIDEYLWRRKRQKKDLFPDFLAVLSEQRKLA